MPDQQIAWRAIGGKGNAGLVVFEPIDVDHTRITVSMDWQPEGVTENLGAALGFDDRQVSAELRRFKELIESRGFETGAWRGRIGACTGPGVAPLRGATPGHGPGPLTPRRPRGDRGDVRDRVLARPVQPASRSRG